MNLNQRTDEEKKEDVQWLIDNLSLDQLRKRQDLIRAQQNLERAKKYPYIMENLQMMERDLQEAVLAKTEE